MEHTAAASTTHTPLPAQTAGRIARGAYRTEGVADAASPTRVCQFEPRLRSAQPRAETSDA
jgi:hypothetical protein